MPQPNTNSALQHFTLWALQQGQFSDRGETQIPQGGAYATSNLLFLDGVIRPRPGCALNLFPPEDYAGRACVHISQTFPYEPETSGLISVFAEGSDFKPYEYTNTGWLDVSPGGLPVVGGLGSSPPVSCSFQGAWFFVGGEHGLLYLPSGASEMKYVSDDQPRVDLRAPDKPRVIASFVDRVILGDCIHPDTGVRTPGYIAWSEHLKPLVWGGGVGGGTSGSTVLPMENQAITAFHCWSDVITVFQSRTVSRGRFVGGQRSFAFDILADGPGCISAGTMSRWEEGKFLWLGPDSVYICRANENPQSIGEPIKKRIRQVVDLNNLHKSRAMVDRVNDLYWLMMPMAGQPGVKKIFCCNLRTTGWFEGEFNLPSPAYSVADIVYTPWEYGLVVGDGSGNILRFGYEAFSDFGNPFTCYWESGTFSGEQLSKGQSQQVIVERARAFSDTQGGQVTVSIKTGDVLDEWVTTNFGIQTTGVGNQDNTLYERTTSGEFFRFRFAFNTVSAAAHVQGITLSLLFGGDTR